MSGYELQQFVMVSPEVWQDLHLRYVESLWPWWLVFLLLNLLVLLKSQRPLFFIYVACCWVFLGVYYFMHFIDQVHTFAFLMGGAFVFQGLAVLYIKSLRPRPELQQPELQQQEYQQLKDQQPESPESYRWLRRTALCVYGVSAFIPLSYVLLNTKESILLFGYGAEQTALGTVALVLFTLRSKIELLLVCIPLVWIGFYLLAL